MRNLLTITVVILVTAFSGTVPALAQNEARSPVEGTWEGELRTERWPVFLSLELTRAGDGLTGSIAVLGRTSELTEASWDGRLLRASVGSGEGALVFEGAIENDRLVGRASQRKDVMPFVFDRVPDYPSPADRIEAWSQDLDALSQRFLRYDRSFSPAQRDLFIERIEQVRARLSDLDDDQIRMKLAAAVSLSNNAHTRLYLLRNRTELRRLPIRLWWFRDGLYVVRATEQYATLLGCRVDEIGKTDARHARDIVSAAFAGNPSWTDYKSVYFLTSPEALNGFGITPDAEAVQLRVSECGAPRAVTIAPLPLLRKERAVEAWWDLSPRHEDPDRKWVHVLAGRLTSPPLYLKQPDRPYWYEFLPESGLLYFHYSRSSDAAGESTKELGERLLAAFAKHPVRGFVLDLRFNTGGNFNLAEDLMKALQERTIEMPRWVITGRATFSAGITHAASWRESGNVTFVGEPAGDGLDFWSEGGNIVLPNSGLYAHFANGAHSYSPEPCPEGEWCVDMSSPDLHPDLPVMSSWREYVNGRDPAMEVIHAALEADSSPQP